MQPLCDEAWYPDHNVIIGVAMIAGVAVPLVCSWYYMMASHFSRYSVESLFRCPVQSNEMLCYLAAIRTLIMNKV